MHLLVARRTTVETAPGEHAEVISLPDLVRSKKTQHHKDWPVKLRLVEANYVCNREQPTQEQIEFWLREGRTPALLREIAKAHPRIVQEIATIRPLLSLVSAGADEAIEDALEAEAKRERESDRAYWKPLREELKRLRLDFPGRQAETGP